MLTSFKEFIKAMSKFSEDIESAIQNIHIEHGVTDAEVTSKVTEAVNAGLSPLQSQVTDLQGQVTELQKAIQDTVVAITNGDIEKAQEIVNAASNTAGNTANGTGDGAGVDNGSTDNSGADNSNGDTGTAGN